MAPISPDSLLLRQSLEKLPQELYDMIYDLTFTAPPGVRQLGTITARFKPITPQRDSHLHLLRVSRHARSKYTASYYGNGAIFVLYEILTLEAWYSALPKAHRNLVTDVRCILCRGGPQAGSHGTRAYHSEALQREGFSQSFAANTRVGWEDGLTSDLPGYEGSRSLAMSAMNDPKASDVARDLAKRLMGEEESTG